MGIIDDEGQTTLILSETLPRYDHEHLYLGNGDKLDPKVFSIFTIAAISKDREANYYYTDTMLGYFADLPLITVRAPQYFIKEEIEDLTRSLIDLETLEE